VYYLIQTTLKMSLHTVLCTQDSLQTCFAGELAEDYTSEEKRLKVEKADVVVVQYNTAAWNARGFFVDGLHFIEEQRLSGSQQHFVLLDYPAVVGMPKENPRNYVLEDPGVLLYIEPPVVGARRDLTELVCRRNEELIGLDAPEKEDLFLDLRQTLYKREGNIDGIKHRVERLLNNAGNLEEVPTAVASHMQQAYRRVKSWGIVEGLPAEPHKLLKDLLANPSDANEKINSWFEHLSSKVRSDRQQQAEDDPKNGLGNILYISQSDADKGQLRECLERQNLGKPYRIHTVPDLQEGLHFAKSINHLPTTVITDFRYRSGGRIAAMNGYNILSRIRRKYPRWQYVMLTNFPVQDNEELPIPSWVEVFPKGRVLQGARAFKRFLSSLLASHYRQRVFADDWPTEVRSQDDEAWKHHYDTFRRSDTYEAAEQAIGEEALEKIKLLLSKKEVTLPNHGYTLHQYCANRQADDSLSEEAAEEAAQRYFQGLLLARRVYLGLFQLDLNDRLPAAHRFYPIGDRQHNYTGYAYALVRPVQFERHAGDARAIANYLGRLRLRITVDYRNKTERKGKISRAEEQWLRDNLSDLRRLNSTI